MTEESKMSEMGEKEQPEQKPAEMVNISAAELQQIRDALKKANNEAAKYRKTAEQVETERKAKEEAEMTALQKAEAKAKDLEARVQQMERARLQSEIAAKVGLPAKLAARLQGDTPEEMEKDAQEILETLPKPPKPQPGPVPTNPGAGGSQTETIQQRLNRIHGGGVGAFEFNGNS